MANRLLVHDWALFRNSFRDAFARKRDRALLAVMAGLAVAWLAGASGPVSAPPEVAWLALLGAPVALGWQRILVARLQWLARESPLAAAALSRTAAAAYLAAAHAIVLAPCAAAVIVLGRASGQVLLAAALFVPAYGAGLALGTLKRTRRRAEAVRKGGRGYAAPPPGRRLAVLRAVLRSQTLGSRRPEIAALAMLAANFVLTLGLARIGRDGAAPVQVALILIPSLAMLLATSRADGALLRFLPSVGYGPIAVAVAVAALPVASFAAATAAVCAGGLAALSAAPLSLALMHAGFALPAVARAWLYPGRHPKSVDLQVQIELVGLVLLAILFPPMAAVALVFRMARLYRRHRALTWAQP